MGIRDWFKTRRSLMIERQMAYDAVDTIVRAARTSDSLEDLIEYIDGKKAGEEVMVVSPSDIAKGELTMSHWATRLLASSFVDIIDSDPKAINYLSARFFDPRTERSIEVVLQKPEGATPAEKAGFLSEVIEGVLQLVTDESRGELSRLIEAKHLLAKSLLASKEEIQSRSWEDFKKRYPKLVEAFHS